MKFLIVEDDKGKERELATLIQSGFPGATLAERRSFQSGLAEAVNGHPDVIILDMSIPTFDSEPGDAESAGQPRPYGGRDLLRELSRKRIESKVIIVTQYDFFNEGHDVMSLDELKSSLAKSFPLNYVATVYYHESQSNWRVELLDALAKSGAVGERGTKC